MGKHGKGLALAFFLVSFLCHAEDSGTAQGIGAFPTINRLDWRDNVFKQYVADVEANRRRIHTQRNRDGSYSGNAQVFLSFLTIYQYTPGEGEDLLSLAARTLIPYSTLASLNRLSHPSMFEAGKPLLLPSAPGLFVPQEPESELETLLATGHLPPADGRSATLAIGGGTMFYYFPGMEFSATERAFFLNTGFRFPLSSYRLTSSFGMRVNPVTGNLRFHEGLDLAAPAGTEVYAAGNGVVTEVGSDPIYGNYIIIRHDGNWASLYGHLQRTAVTLRTNVRSGMLIGWVGSTGQSTGPHLHFELRQNGMARDPDKYLFLPGRR